VSFEEPVVRPVQIGDAQAIIDLVERCFVEYGEFAPPGWTPTSQDGALERVEASIALAGAGGAVAERDGEHAGQVLWIPAVGAHNYESEDPYTAYLSQLFVSTRFRGTGLAGRLLAWAVRMARGLRYREMRLLTPRGQGRARAFYEREGWSELGDWGVHPELGLPVVEYGRRL
jgi:GNAT superfamily N-acetyltransferase